MHKRMAYFQIWFNVFRFHECVFHFQKLLFFGLFQSFGLTPLGSKNSKLMLIFSLNPKANSKACVCRCFIFGGTLKLQIPFLYLILRQLKSFPLSLWYHYVCMCFIFNVILWNLKVVEFISISNYKLVQKLSYELLVSLYFVLLIILFYMIML